MPYLRDSRSIVTPPRLSMIEAATNVQGMALVRLGTTDRPINPARGSKKGTAAA